MIDNAALGELLCSLIAAAFGTKKIDVQSFSHLEDNDWKRLFELARDNNVAAISGDGIELLPTNCRPPRMLWLTWLGLRQEIEERSKHQQSVLEQLVKIFNEHGIDTLVLKGPAISRWYPTPSHREFNDLDIYHYGKQPQADKIVTDMLGCVVKNDSYHHTKYTFRHVSVENHYTFVNSRNQRSNSHYEKLLLQHLPSPTFEALFLLRHTSGHFASGRITLRNILDWMVFAEHHRHDLDWHYITEVLDKFNMTPFVTAVNAILEHRLGMMPLNIMPQNDDTALQQRIYNDILFGELEDPEHKKEDLSRIVWKIKRFYANRWKHKICYNDPWLASFFRGVFVHLLKPRTILHKM